jgi:hypothetical protein
MENLHPMSSTHAVHHHLIAELGVTCSQPTRAQLASSGICHLPFTGNVSAFKPDRVPKGGLHGHITPYPLEAYVRQWQLRRELHLHGERWLEDSLQLVIQNDLALIPGVLGALQIGAVAAAVKKGATDQRVT